MLTDLRRTRAFVAGIALALAGARHGFAQGMPLAVDASAAFVPAGPADFQGGASRAPDGTVLGVTDRYLTRNGKPWLPVMGELHFSRVPEAEWEEEILKMKSAGVDIISTYIIWIHHEEIRGTWEWSGQRDLRHFAELCRKHHMLLYPRIGPWAHGEARNGGFPDWVVQQGRTRELDPEFMAATRALYRQIGLQLRGLMWKDGGPVVGVQVENEYTSRGPGKGAEYIIALKRMALESGMDVPLYTVTGWGDAPMPPHEVLPVYGGYPDAPWGSSQTVLPPGEVYAFRFGSRENGSMGLIGQAQPSSPATVPVDRMPFLTAELGGGIEGTYHRRPVIAPDDIVAMMPVMLGSGVNGYGSYMFHGGENPAGKLSTLQESQATHYPTDVPQKSYDFQAPISEFGLERPSLRLLKGWDYFLNDFGALLAPMPVFAPTILPADPLDLKVLRWSVRTDGEAGFLFVNNYVREFAMPAHHAAQFAVTLAGGRVQQIPETPIDLPSGAYFAWPFGLDLGPVHLRYGTARLMTRLHDAGGETFVFACMRGVRCELALEGEALALHTPKQVRVQRRSGEVIVEQTGDPQGLEPVTVRTKAGTSVRLLLLSPEQAFEAWRIPGATTQRLLLTAADVWMEGGSVSLAQLGDPRFHFSLYPASAPPPTSRVPIKSAAKNGYEADVPSEKVTLEIQRVREAGQVPRSAPGPGLSWRPEGVAQAPTEAIWEANAARWSLHLSARHLSSAMPDLFLRVRFAADQARLARGTTLLDDTFYDGEPWVVGLKRFLGTETPPFELQLLPMRADAPIYVPKVARTRIATKGQTVSLESVTLLPQYKLRLDFPGTAANDAP